MDTALSAGEDKGWGGVANPNGMFSLCFEFSVQLRGGSTHRHSACCQGRTGSRVCTGTCSSPWCWGTRSSCRSQATGTRWYLWNMQRVTGETSEVFPDYGNLIKLCFPFCWETPRELLGQTWCKYWYQILCAAILHRARREFFFIACRPAEML